MEDLNRRKSEVISFFTGVEFAAANFKGFSEYVSRKGGGIVIDSSIERCGATCANSLAGKNNCSVINNNIRCDIRTVKSIRSG